MITLEVQGMRELEAYLQQVIRKIDNALPLMRRISLFLDAELKRTMTAGKDPNGKALAPTAVWTRTAGVGAGTSRKGKPKPLMNTGRLRAEMGEVRIGKTFLEFGFRGKFRDIADRMINGKSGKMRVRQKSIKGEYSGIRATKVGTKNIRRRASRRHLYIRVKTAKGWITKQVTQRSIDINPQPRNFFFLGKKHIDGVVKLGDEFIAEAIA